MKKLGSIILGIILSCLIVLPVNAKENEMIKLYLFYGDGCPHCAAEKEYLAEVKEKYAKGEIELNSEDMKNVVFTVYEGEEDGK